MCVAFYRLRLRFLGNVFKAHITSLRVTQGGQGPQPIAESRRGAVTSRACKFPRSYPLLTSK